MRTVRPAPAARQAATVGGGRAGGALAGRGRTLSTCPRERRRSGGGAMAELAIRGGTSVRPQGYPAWPVHDERDVEAVAAVVRGGNWGGFPEPGPNAADFESRFAAYQGAAHGILMSNGTITMEVALKALGIGWGDEVIIPSLTFAATAYAVVAAGAVPGIVDAARATWTVDPERVEAAVTPRTKAILPVHLAHQMADLDALMAIP